MLDEFVGARSQRPVATATPFDMTMLNGIDLVPRVLAVGAPEIRNWQWPS